MIIAVVEGHQGHEQRLWRVLAAAGSTFEVRRSGLAEGGMSGRSGLASIGGLRRGRDDDQEPPRALVFEAIDRPDLAGQALDLVRADRYFVGVAMIVAVRVEHLREIEPAVGFDDFVLYPYAPEELYGRLRGLEWRRGAILKDERMGGIVFDRAGHEVHVNGRAVRLTVREFALFSFLWTRRGLVLSRKDILTHVWGADYEGGQRTVDIHIRRLRMKLGDTFPLETLHGVGYKLRVLDPEEGTPVTPFPLQYA